MAGQVDKAGRTWLAAGTRLNDTYELEEGIAAGGMGEVYRGHNIETGDPVAIKMIRSDLAETEATMTMFRKEASALNKLYHEAIVRYYGFSVDPTLKRPYMAMEFVAGRSLGDTVHERPLDFAQLCVLGARVASGLEAAHRRGIIHRDISPDNVIIPEGDVGETKIIDFGIARQTRSEGTIVGDGLAGKYNYMSPEQLGLNGGDVQAPSDIYSLGLVLAEAITGRAIDMRGNPVELIEKRRRVPDLAHVDPRLAPLIAWMLQPEPQMRPASMGEVARWLAAAGETLAGPGPAAVASGDDERTVVAPSLRPGSLPPQSFAGRSMPPASFAPSMPPRATTPPSVPPHAMAAASVAPQSMPPQAVAHSLPPGWGAEPSRRPPTVPPPSVPPVSRPAEAASAPMPLPAGWADAGRSMPPTGGTQGGRSMPPPGWGEPAPRSEPPHDEATVVARTTTAPPPSYGAMSSASPFSRDATPAGPSGAAPAAPFVTPSAPPAVTTKEPATDTAAAAKRSALPLVAAVAAAVVLAGGGGAWWFLGRTPSPPGEGPRPVLAGGSVSGGPTERPAGPAGDVARWVADWTGGACTHLEPIVVAEDRVVGDGYAASIVPFEGFDEAFRARNGFEADIRLRQVSAAQCPAVDLLARARGEAAAVPRLELAQGHVHGGDFVTGLAAARGGRRVAVIEVRDDGSARVVSTATADGGPTPFVLPVEPGAASGRPRLVVALAATQALPAFGETQPQPIAGLVEKLERDARRAGDRLVATARYVVVER